MPHIIITNERNDSDIFAHFARACDSVHIQMVRSVRQIIIHNNNKNIFFLNYQKYTRSIVTCVILATAKIIIIPGYRSLLLVHSILSFNRFSVLIISSSYCFHVFCTLGISSTEKKKIEKHTQSIDTKEFKKRKNTRMYTPHGCHHLQLKFR